MITVTSVLILWGQGKNINLNYSWTELLRTIVLSGHSWILNLKTFYHRMSWFPMNSALISDRLFYLCIKPYLCVVVAHAILTLWHRRTNCKSCSLRPELLGASSPPLRGQPLYGTRRHEDKVVYCSRDHGPQSVVTQYFTPLTLATD